MCCHNRVRVVIIKSYVDRWTKKYYINFQKYTIIGAVFTLYEIFFLWVFVDMLKSATLISTALIIGSSTMLKFYLYVYSGMMENNLFRYALILVLFYSTQVILVWLLVETLGFFASISSGLATIVLFIIRFFAFDKFKLLKK